MHGPDLLVHVPRGGRRDDALRLALPLAARLGARLDALNVAPMPPAAFTVPEAVPLQLDEARQRRQEAFAQAEWYGTQLGTAALEGEWLVGQGDPVPLLCHVAAGYDLLVIERDGERSDAPLGFGTVSRTVFGCRCPTLVVPAGTPIRETGLRICVAWNGSRESMLALHGALPLLRHAEAVRVLDGHDADAASADPLAPPTPAVADWLRRHELDPEIVAFRPDGPSGPAIEAAADAFGADLLVMGAWGRSRLSELVLGGATRHLFGHGERPMLVAH